MRIAFDHQIFSWQRYGGVSRYFFELARHLTKIPGVDVTVVAPIFVNQYLRGNSGVHVVGRYFPQIPKTGRILQILNAAAVQRQLRKIKPDVVHETYYYERRLAPQGVPVVVTIHDMIYEKFPQFYPSWDRTRYLKREAVRRADQVICVSENTKRDLMEILEVPEDRISVIHHGYSLTGNASLNQPGSIAGPYVLFVGLRGGYKNFRTFLQAYALSKMLKNNFRIVCFGGGSLTRSELEYMERLGVQQDGVVHLTGSDELLSTVYRHAAALVYPSLYEGFGIPPLEAMAHGCPVICSSTSSLPEVCGDAASYFDPNEAQEIQRVVEDTVGSSARLEDLKRRGLERIKLFSWEACAAQTVQVYRALAVRAPVA